VTRLGSHQEIRLDIRLIAASHKNLADAVSQGSFRQDLFYRLNVVPIHMPALRERKEDIPRLIQHFLQQHQQRYQQDGMPLSPATLRKLMTYDWPGNVRELSNCIERFVLLQDEAELLAALQLQTPATSGFVLPEQGLNWEQFERLCLAQALQRCAGNRTQAAKLLQLPYKAFLYRLEKHQLTS